MMRKSLACRCTACAAEAAPWRRLCLMFKCIVMSRISTPVRLCISRISMLGWRMLVSQLHAAGC